MFRLVHENEYHLYEHKGILYEHLLMMEEMCSLYLSLKVLDFISSIFKINMAVVKNLKTILLRFA